MSLVHAVSITHFVRFCVLRSVISLSFLRTNYCSVSVAHFYRSLVFQQVLETKFNAIIVNIAQNKICGESFSFLTIFISHF